MMARLSIRRTSRETLLPAPGQPTITASSLQVKAQLRRTIDYSSGTGVWRNSYSLRRSRYVTELRPCLPATVTEKITDSAGVLASCQGCSQNSVHGNDRECHKSVGEIFGTSPSAVY